MSERGRRRIARGLLTAAVVSIAVAAGLIRLGPAARDETPGIGDPVRIGSGHLIVMAARDVGDPMSAAMTSQNHAGLAAAGMPMSGMSNPDPIAPGMRRVRIDVRVAAGDEALSFPAELFSVTFAGATPIAPRASFLGDAAVAPGLMAFGNLQFEIPIEWSDPQLLIRGSKSPVVFHLDAGSSSSSAPHDH